MTSMHLVKIKFGGDLRILEIASPPRLDELVTAVREAYSLDNKAQPQLNFTYKDSDGDAVRFDTDTELDLAIRNSAPPLRVTVEKERPPSETAARPQAAARPDAGRTAPDVAPVPPMNDVPSTPGYAVASNVGSVGGDEEDMIMVDLPREAALAANSGGMGRITDADAEPEEEAVDEIDPPAAFEAETAAARDPEGSLLYQKASLRLARHFKVHLTPTQLWRVMALFQIQGRQLVVFGLAPRRALDADTDPSVCGASSDEEGSGSSAGLKRSKSSIARGLVAHPVHRLLELNGVEMPEEEVQPLLQALRVRPRRLGRLGLLPREVLANLPDGHGEGASRHGSHGHRMHPPPHFGPPGRFGGPGRGGRGHRPFHGPPPVVYQHRMMAGGPPPQGTPPGPPPGEGGYPPQHPGQHPPPPPPARGSAPPGQRPPHMGGPHWQMPHSMHPPHVGQPPEGQHGESGWGGPSMGGPPGPYPPMWPAPPGPHAFGGYGHAAGMMAGGFGYGGWGDWGGGFGGVGSGGGCGGGGHPRRGFGKGGKDNMAMARFVSHPSGSDVTQVASSQSFKKSWRVRNDSTTTWPETCSLVPASQSCQDLSSPPEAPVVGDVAPGEEVTVSVDLVAPSQPGMYEGFWRIRDNSFRKFGQRLWTKVMVVGTGEDVNAGVEKLSLDDGNKDT